MYLGRVAPVHGTLFVEGWDGTRLPCATVGVHCTPFDFGFLHVKTLVACYSRPWEVYLTCGRFHS